MRDEPEEMSFWNPFFEQGETDSKNRKHPHKNKGEYLPRASRKIGTESGRQAPGFRSDTIPINVVSEKLSRVLAIARNGLKSLENPGWSGTGMEFRMVPSEPFETQDCLPMTPFKNLSPETLTPEERLREVAAILALGVIRLRTLPSPRTTQKREGSTRLPLPTART